MTKQDILKMKNSVEIMSALARNRDIWDEELSTHLKNMKRQENIGKFGESDIIYTPPKLNDKCGTEDG